MHRMNRPSDSKLAVPITPSLCTSRGGPAMQKCATESGNAAARWPSNSSKKAAVGGVRGSSSLPVETAEGHGLRCR